MIVDEEGEKMREERNRKRSQTVPFKVVFSSFRLYYAFIFFYCCVFFLSIRSGLITTTVAVVFVVVVVVIVLVVVVVVVIVVIVVVTTIIRCLLCFYSRFSIVSYPFSYCG